MTTNPRWARELAELTLEMGSSDTRRSRRPPRQRHVVILGMMGAGKTTVAELLAVRLGRPHRDSDRDIESLTGRTGRQIAIDDGVDELHRSDRPSQASCPPRGGSSNPLVAERRSNARLCRFGSASRLTTSARE